MVYKKKRVLSVEYYHLFSFSKHSYIFRSNNDRLRASNTKSQVKVKYKTNTVELHLSALNGTTSHPDIQKINIIVFFFVNRLHWQFEVEKNV